ncbi:hypothetical protein [Streptomyces sp. NPDC049590]|uniref:EamA family transporter n=1 Tax=Streptomyces sp. NPDC049590 TaxID=3154834 RepID=UPI00344A7E97
MGFPQRAVASDFTGGLAARRRPAPVLLVARGAATALLTACLPFGIGHPTAGDLPAGAAAGLCAAVGSLCLYAALARGPMSTGAPLTAHLVAALPVAFGPATGEHLRPTARAGIPLALVATALIARPASSASTPRPHRPALVRAVASGAAFAGFFVLLSRPAPGSGPSPLAAAHLAATTVLAAATVLVRARPSGDRLAFPRRLSLTTGITELAAHLCHQYAVRGGLPGIAAVLTAFCPAATTLPARFILHERPTRAQLAGYPLGLAAVTLLALARPA